MKSIIKKMAALFTACTMAVAAAGCSNGPATTTAGSGGSSGSPVGVGFIFVGTKDDYGYNQAAYKASLDVEQRFGDKINVFRSENIPETSEATRVLEQMLQQGATVLFPTSYGHLDPALDAAEENPNCVFFHQGGLKTSENLGTYFGTIWESFYLAGIAAGSTTKSSKLGFITSFAIPQIMLNINAFTLGAKSVNPEITTTVIFTGDWSDPALQTDAVNSLADGGCDVIATHQDSTKTIVELCESKGIYVCGCHADAGELAPTHWLTAPVWNWSDLFVDMTQTALDGKFKGSVYDGKYRGGLKEGVIDIAPYGSAVSAELREKIDTAKKQMIDGTLFAFEGEIKDRDGNVRIAAGTRPSVDELETCDWFVEGVIGSAN